MIHRILLLIFLILGSIPLQAGSISDLCKKKDLGWHFYCDEKKQQKKKIAKKPDPIPVENILDRLEREKREVEDALATAIYYPTEENVFKYMLLNKKQLEMSQKFGETTRKVILNNPYMLDASLDNPVNTLARRVKSKEERLQKISTVRRLNDRYGVYFFYLSSCEYCHIFSKTLRRFADKHGLSVLPISADGGALPEWENYVVDKGQISKLGIKVFPTVLLFDTKEKEMINIGTGLISEEELLNNIYIQVGDEQI